VSNQTDPRIVHFDRIKEPAGIDFPTAGASYPNAGNKNPQTGNHLLLAGIYWLTITPESGKRNLPNGAQAASLQAFEKCY